MHWLMNNATAEPWLILLCAGAATATLTAIGCFFFAWRKRFIIEDDPVPHCNLQERLAQIANTPTVQGMKLALRDPVATSGRS
jgi:hypothetical protein